MAVEDGNKEIKIDSVPLPVDRVVTTLQPWINLSEGKVTTYNLRALVVWRALVSTNFTMLSDPDSYHMLMFLVVTAFISMGIVIGTHTATSTVVDNNGGVTNQVGVLMSFVLGGYISLVVNRWQSLLSEFIQLTNLVENIVVYAHLLIQNNPAEVNSSVPDAQDTDTKAATGPNRKPAYPQLSMKVLTRGRNNVMRQGRLLVMLMFHSLRDGEKDSMVLDSLQSHHLLLPTERPWLEACSVESRPMIVVSWIWQAIQKLGSKGGVHLPDEGRLLVTNSITSIRASIQNIQNTIGCPFSFAYVHVIYWILELYLVILAVETGMMLAMYMRRAGNGDGSYTSDDDITFPKSPAVWYWNTVLQLIAGNVVYTLFANGILKICDKMQNPFSADDSSFAEFLSDANIQNNCMAMIAAQDSFNDLIKAEFDATIDVDDVKAEHE